ncbi:uncharacterized protein M421DRAFT_391420 [Didymella exigua CBS 183.55]|uniref:SET domain-containing protein n=1 Tax=Didymella exigua CBS 183.55 TaxID=1150837 RepID=A0A6A5RSX2_9PLEO|nr:uncharacterized protein M421DRAFT_391420 [Didymella exigua CBS 183.55]KAF1928587.1 hypothetical protein M421DRAFT_391420 [Didymella exigua CBS 183.55]
MVLDTVQAVGPSVPCVHVNKIASYLRILIRLFIKVGISATTLAGNSTARTWQEQRWTIAIRARETPVRCWSGSITGGLGVQIIIVSGSCRPQEPWGRWRFSGKLRSGALSYIGSRLSRIGEFWAWTSRNRRQRRSCYALGWAVSLTPPTKFIDTVTKHIPMHQAPFKLAAPLGRGYDAFATRKIASGSIILRESALFTIRKPHPFINDSDIWAALRTLSSSSQQQFYCLCDNGGAEFRSFTEAFSENCFTVPSAMTREATDGIGCYILLSRINHSCVSNAKIPDTAIEGTSIACFTTRDIAEGE